MNQNDKLCPLDAECKYCQTTDCPWFANGSRTTEAARTQVISLQRRAKRLGKDLQGLYDNYLEICGKHKDELEVWIDNLQDFHTLLRNLNMVILQVNEMANNEKDKIGFE